jgi:microcompartment protein CcmK/EutM
MYLARVTGRLVATIRTRGLEGVKLSLIQHSNPTSCRSKTASHRWRVPNTRITWRCPLRRS